MARAFHTIPSDSIPTISHSWICLFGLPKKFDYPMKTSHSIPTIPFLDWLVRAPKNVAKPDSRNRFPVDVPLGKEHITNTHRSNKFIIDK